MIEAKERPSEEDWVSELKVGGMVSQGGLAAQVDWLSIVSSSFAGTVTVDVKKTSHIQGNIFQGQVIFRVDGKDYSPADLLGLRLDNRWPEP